MFYASFTQPARIEIALRRLERGAPLSEEVWVKISVIDGLLQFTRHHPPDWLIYPADWIGVHKILSQIPRGVGFIVLGLVWAIIVGVVWAIRLGFVGWKLEEYSKLKRTKKAEKAGAKARDLGRR